MKKVKKEFRFSDEESGRLIFLIHQYALRELNESERYELIHRLDTFRTRLDPKWRCLFEGERIVDPNFTYVPITKPLPIFKEKNK